LIDQVDLLSPCCCGRFRLVLLALPDRKEEDRPLLGVIFSPSLLRLGLGVFLPLRSGLVDLLSFPPLWFLSSRFIERIEKQGFFIWTFLAFP